ncbi:MAG: hypothetical protein IJF97_08710, partial [Eggerthellaceae bacterium]|nr:hypothetical protein [Eggerthellaceae bacterium]
ARAASMAQGPSLREITLACGMGSPAREKGNDMKRCAFVTGASGFLGSYVVRDLLCEGFDYVYA